MTEKQKTKKAVALAIGDYNDGRAVIDGNAWERVREILALCGGRVRFEVPKAYEKKERARLQAEGLHDAHDIDAAIRDFAVLDLETPFSIHAEDGMKTMYVEEMFLDEGRVKAVVRHADARDIAEIPSATSTLENPQADMPSPLVALLFLERNI